MRDVYPAVHGKTRLLTIKGQRWLQINGAFYRLTNREAVWTLTKSGSGTTYNVSLTNADLPRCDCPDLTFRDREDGCCKHVKALKAVGLIR